MYRTAVQRHQMQLNNSKLPIARPNPELCKYSQQGRSDQQQPSSDRLEQLRPVYIKPWPYNPAPVPGTYGRILLCSVNKLRNLLIFMYAPSVLRIFFYTLIILTHLNISFIHIYVGYIYVCCHLIKCVQIFLQYRQVHLTERNRRVAVFVSFVIGSHCLNNTEE